MPIISIISQPATNSLNAAYRPVVFQVRASNTDNTAVPPVVYCDIYFNGTFYKTIDKTQYKILNTTDSDWQFDIQDACQEIFNKIIGLYGGSSIIKIDELLMQGYCKFRSSGYNAGGFITAENSAPVQGTGTVSPTSGTGTQSRTFYILNTALQHQNNQDLSTHLASYKNGTWQNIAFPLTHRLNSYNLGIVSNDYFPFVYIGSKALKCIKIFYRNKNQTSYTSVQNCNVQITGSVGGGGGGSCIAVTIPGSQTLPNGQVGTAYSATINLNGTGPFTLTNIVKPSWMSLVVSGSSVNITGTPDVAGTNISVSFTANNCSSQTANYSSSIDVAALVNGTINVLVGLNPCSIGHPSASGTVTAAPGSIVHVRMSMSGTDSTATLSGDVNGVSYSITNATSPVDFTITMPGGGSITWTQVLNTVVSSESGGISLF